MAWATAGNIVTTNLDAGTDSLASARVDLKAALDELTIVSQNLGTLSGAAKVEANGVVQASVTGVGTTSGDLTLSPNSGKVKITDVINLPPKTVAELNALSSKEEGDVAYVSNDVGGKALAVYDGSDWKKLTLGGAIGT